MIDNLITFMLTQPRRLMEWGMLLARTGALLLAFGAIGRIATTGISVIQGMAAHARPVIAIADVLPGIPTWWIPETIFGFAFALLLIVAGLAAVYVGRAYERLCLH